MVRRQTLPLCAKDIAWETNVWVWLMKLALCLITASSLPYSAAPGRRRSPLGASRYSTL